MTCSILLQKQNSQKKRLVKMYQYTKQCGINNFKIQQGENRRKKILLCS